LGARLLELGGCASSQCDRAGIWNSQGGSGIHKEDGGGAPFGTVMPSGLREHASEEPAARRIARVVVEIER
jgi:hypothetical protein